MNNGFLKWAKKYHKWPALVISIFLIFFSLSGIILNHRSLFSHSDVSRKLLPSSYRLQNWNLASVRSVVILSDGSRLIFGNSGIWKTDSLYSVFSDFNYGFPEGMDMRKVRAVRETSRGNLLAGTFFGLYEYSYAKQGWSKINLPVKNQRIQDIICKDDKVIVLTRSEVISMIDRQGFDSLFVTRLSAPAGYDRKMSLFRFLWITHSGEIAGIAGRLLIDFLALLIIFLVSTGLVVFLVPKISRKLKSRSGSLADFRRKNLHLHNITGAWFIVFLIVVPLTGMFLRPPFLIPVANAKIPMLPLKIAGKENPWEDKLRSVLWSDEAERFIISTSDGFYHCDSVFASAPAPFEIQPPVSVMGINVFEYGGNGTYIVGSFDGLFRWDPAAGSINDLLEPQKPVSGRGKPGRPSANLISGMISDNGLIAVFDYDRGVVSETMGRFPAMPQTIIDKSPMPLWNVAQEIHTGRIYQSILGPFYILIVPLTGLLTILVFITGYIRWRKIYREKH